MLYCGEVVRPLKGILAQLGKLEAFDFSRVRVHLAEINAIEHKPMYMSDYVKQLDSILTSGNRKLLIGAGSVSHRQAIDKAKEEYRKYQEVTLSPVEEEYLKSIKSVQKQVKKTERQKRIKR